MAPSSERGRSGREGHGGPGDADSDGREREPGGAGVADLITFILRHGGDGDLAPFLTVVLVGAGVGGCGGVGVGGANLSETALKG